MKRGFRTTDAVVLNSIDYGESDRILSFFTERYGKVTGIAKGARRSRKRFVGNLEPACRVRLAFVASGRSRMVRVEEAKLLHGASVLKSDVEGLGAACYLLELTSEMTREGLVMPGIYRLLAGTLALLDGGADVETITRSFEVRMLSEAGFMPRLSRCVGCDTPAEEAARAPSRLFFSSARGGVVCSACSPAGGMPLSAGTAAFLVMAERMSPGKLARLKPAGAMLEEAESLMEDFIRYQLGRELKTRKFMEKMRSSRLADEAGFDPGAHSGVESV